MDGVKYDSQLFESVAVGMSMSVSVRACAFGVLACVRCAPLKTRNKIRSNGWGPINQSSGNSDQPGRAKA